MLGFIISVAIGLIMFVLVFIAIALPDPDGDEIVLGIIGGGIIGSGVALFLSLLLVGHTGGLMSDYKEGVARGYITDLRYGGLIYKTHDGIFRPESDNLTTLNSGAEFSIVDENVLQEAHDALNNSYRVRITYRMYFMKNFEEGKDVIVTGIEFIDGEQ